MEIAPPSRQVFFVCKDLVNIFESTNQAKIFAKEVFLRENNLCVLKVPRVKKSAKKKRDKEEERITSEDRKEDSPVTMSELKSQQEKKKEAAAAAKEVVVEEKKERTGDEPHPDVGTPDKVYDYDYRDLHADLQKGARIGSYGWDNACYLAIAEKRANVDLDEFHSKRTPDEIYNADFKWLLDQPGTQNHWKRIVTFDPFGMTATNPTIACTTAHLKIPELDGKLKCGDKYDIVEADGYVKTTKAAVYHAWNLPALAQRLKLKESDLRETLFKYTNNKDVHDPKKRAFLPNVGGQTIYIFGDPKKIRDKQTEISVRVHDECNGSDVFGTSICTCRPYLVFALKVCIETAQRGGVGVIVYFRKEGRSLGEVTKYRVYNARRNQKGGDTAEKYFYHTESIAGIRDARFQTMMPDVLNFLGIGRIAHLLSMSNEKYDAIMEAGIRVDARIPLPDMYVPKHAFVELTAKIMSGYHSEEMQGDAVLDEMRKLGTIRDQCKRVYELAKQGKLLYFDVDEKAMAKTADLVCDVIKKRYPSLEIPMHSRLRHFPQSTLETLKEKWTKYQIAPIEQTRRMIDLLFVSVLLDAGAGSNWKYIDRDSKEFSRSEGLGVASLDMFLDGLFSSDDAVSTRVNGLGLKKLTVRDLGLGFQVSASNKMVGLEGRCGLLQRLGQALIDHPEFFGYEVSRPGHILDYVLKYTEKDEKSGKLTVSVKVLWRAIISGLEAIWPNRFANIQRGDIHPLNSLKQDGKAGSDLVPFHKLSQWLAYSVIDAIKSFGIHFCDMNLMTALAEYRNGGLLIDTGVLIPRSKVDREIQYGTSSEVIVEWRALTIISIDLVAEQVRKKLGKTEKEMPLSSILEGGTWQAGREIARKLRPETGGPPLNIRSDGTVF